MKFSVGKLVLALFVASIVVVMAFTVFFMPAAWHWNANNLQVHITRNPAAKTETGSLDEGCGWSKSPLCLLDWRKSHGTSGSTTSDLDMRITGVSRSGVWVRVRYNVSGKEALSADRTIFVAPGAPVKVDISPEYYIHGYFEP